MTVVERVSKNCLVGRKNSGSLHRSTGGLPNDRAKKERGQSIGGGSDKPDSLAPPLSESSASVASQMLYE